MLNTTYQSMPIIDFQYKLYLFYHPWTPVKFCIILQIHVLIYLWHRGVYPMGGDGAECAIANIGGKKFANVFGGKKCVSRRGETQVSMYVYGHLGVKYMCSPAAPICYPLALPPNGPYSHTLNSVCMFSMLRVYCNLLSLRLCVLLRSV